jgi:predicted ATPase/class 3 adenylate cyclase
MSCRSCGAEILPGRKFCTACGAPVSEALLFITCIACGSSNPVAAKFCGKCGRAFEAAVSAAARPAEYASYEIEPDRQRPDAERRQLTVQFCDLVGSTELSTRLDPENLRDVIGAYHRVVADTVARFEGYVAKYMGDGVLVYFGYPQAHEDDAERAVRAALALVDVVGTIEAPERLRLRVGIATGLVVVGDLVGSGEAQERRVVGETPNLAARLQVLAKPDEVVIAPSTRRLLGNLFEYRDLGAVELKGFAAPVEASQVLREGVAESRFEAVRAMQTLTPLVGREAEIAVLLDRWQRAKRGSGQVALITAEPGIGKSRLVTALVQERLPAEPPHTRLRYFCSPHHTDSALYPVVTQLERAAAFVGADAPSAKLDKLEALLAATSPSAQDVTLLAELLSIPTDGRYPALDLSPQRKREKTLEALLGLLAGLARQHPLLMIFEDVHWIDPSSRDLLQLIVEQVLRLPVLLLITFRPEFEPPPWSGQAHVTTLELRRLDRGEAAAIVERITHGKALPGEIMEQILAKTDGVPLFIEELTKMILESGLLEDRGDRYELAGPLISLAIPTTLQDSLMARLDRLGRVKEVAQIGAAIGQAFSYSLLAAVAPLRGVDLQKALDQLGDAGLIFRREDAQQASYAFKHALVQDAAYQSLLRSSRQKLHARIAGVLEERFPEIVETDPGFLAHHCTEASLSARAVDYRLKAGMRAIERSGAVEAVSELEKGLKVMPSLPVGPTRDAQELGLQLTLAAVLVGARGYPTEESGRILARARELCDRTGERARLLPVLFLQSGFFYTRAETDTMRKLGEEMQRLGREWGDTAAQLMGGHQIALGLHMLGEFGSSRAQFEEVLAIYDPVQHRPLTFLFAQNPRVTTLGFLSFVYFELGYPEQALRLIEQALAESRELAHFNTTAFAHTYASSMHQLRGEWQATRQHAEALITLSSEQRLAYWIAAGHFFHGWAVARGGDLETGLAELREGAAGWRAMGSRNYVPYALTLEAEVLRAAGQHSQRSLDLLGEAVAMANATRERWYEAETYRLKGECLLSLPIPDEDGAEAAFVHALELARGQNAKMWELRAATCLARLWRGHGRPDDARDVLAPVYAWFTEGFEMPDLRQAASLLDGLRW